jgi:predicted Zn-dependent protease
MIILSIYVLSIVFIIYTCKAGSHVDHDQNPVLSNQARESQFVVPDLNELPPTSQTSSGKTLSETQDHLPAIQSIEKEQKANKKKKTFWSTLSEAERARRSKIIAEKARERKQKMVSVILGLVDKIQLRQ